MYRRGGWNLLSGILWLAVVDTPDSKFRNANLLERTPPFFSESNSAPMSVALVSGRFSDLHNYPFVTP